MSARLIRKLAWPSDCGVRSSRLSDVRVRGRACERLGNTVPMIASAHPPSGLSKAIWTDADFPVMGWHDCRIRAVSITEYEDDTVPPTRLLLDLDYIVRWVDPVPPEKHFTFWIAPATLVFEKAWDITGQFGPLHDLLDE